METDVNFISYFEEDLLEIKKIILSNLKDKDINVQSLLNNLGVANGKMIRVIFVLIGGSFGKVEKNKLHHIAAAVEILHLATLVHDDIVDDSNLRRGKETINVTHGIKSALFMGDYLFSEAYILFSKFLTLKTITNISETIKVICKSEINQFLTAYSLSSTIKDYLRRINGKCATLFSLSLSIGAIEGEVDNKGEVDNNVIQKLKKIGYYTGMAFQLVDDILDITMKEIILGKPTESDIKNGIYSLPILIEIRDNNVFLINALEDNDLAKVLDIVKNSNGLRKSKEVAQRYSYKALKLIDELSVSPERVILKSIVETLLSRNF